MESLFQGILMFCHGIMMLIGVGAVSTLGGAIIVGSLLIGAVGAIFMCLFPFMAASLITSEIKEYSRPHAYFKGRKPVTPHRPTTGGDITKLFSAK